MPFRATTAAGLMGAPPDGNGRWASAEWGMAFDVGCRMSDFRSANLPVLFARSCFILAITADGLLAVGGDGNGNDGREQRFQDGRSGG